jgi:hypothetical protein
MLNSVVPTCEYVPAGPATGAGGFAFASIANTSRSGIVNIISASRMPPFSSVQCVPSYLTITDVSACS